MSDLSRRQFHRGTLGAVGAAALGGSFAAGTGPAAAAVSVLKTTYYSQFSQNRYFTYPHQNGFWDNYSKSVLGQLEADNSASLWKYDPVANTSTQLTRTMKASNYRSYVYYDVCNATNVVAFSAENKIWVANLVGDANLRAIYTPPSDQEPDDLVGIHPNGTHVVTAIRPIGYKEGKGPSTLVRIKISDGTSENLCTQQFYLNHAHYSRNDPNWIAFSRDSSSDRMWAWHATLAPNGKAMWDGKFEGQQQAVGHEVWTPHNRTSGIAVAYPGTSKNGIYEVRTDGTVSLVKAGGFWHLNTSYDNAWLAYDQTGGGVGVIERSTGTVTQLATTGSGSHPKHPHPHLSRYATVLVYNDTNSDGQVRVVALKFR